MNSQTKDRRVRKTKKALRDSLAYLLADKNIRDVSVQELVDRADLNRATFYLHYKDIYDLHQQIEDEVVHEINWILEQHLPDEHREPYPFFVTLLQYIADNAALCGMLLGDNSNHSFLDKLCAIVEECCMSHWLEQHDSQNTKDELSYFSSYIIYGYVAVITRWVKMGMQDSPEHLAEMMGKMGMFSIGFLKRR